MDINKMFRLLWGVLGCWLLMPMISWAQVSFTASTNARQVVENGYFDVTFTLENAKGTNFRAPSFQGFEVVSGPSRSMSTSIINGKASQKMGFSYTLQPNKIGKLTIPPARIDVNGKELTTNELTVDVVKSSAASKAGAVAEELFVRAEIDTSQVYLGQQLIVNYKLYTTVNIESYDISSEPEYLGFYAHDIRRFNSRPVREVFNGVQYTTKVLKRVALFPQQTGLQTIEPVNLRLGVVVGNRRSNSFFFNSQIRPVNVQTNSLEIDVLPLPKPVPPRFSGAVGRYSMNSFCNNNRISTDDALAIQLQIEGDGDIKRLQAPPVTFPEGFEVYEPKTLRESSGEQGGVLMGQKVFEYLAIPDQQGQYTIQPGFTYFDTDSLKYVTLAPNRFPVNVRKGRGRSGSPASERDYAVNQDIRYLMTDTRLQSLHRIPLVERSWFYGLLIMPLLVLGGAVFYKKRQTRQAGITLAVLRQRKAQKVAVKKLVTAEKHLQAGESRQFYDEVSRALLGYVCDKLNIPLSELTKENVRQKLVELKVNDKYIEQFMSIIKTTEMALFAGMDNSKSMQQVYQDAAQTITSIEEELRTDAY